MGNNNKLNTLNQKLVTICCYDNDTKDVEKTTNIYLQQGWIIKDYKVCSSAYNSRGFENSTDFCAYCFITILFVKNNFNY